MDDKKKDLKKYIESIKGLENTVEVRKRLINTKKIRHAEPGDLEKEVI